MSDYDFIVVGAGAGGSVVANRLSEVAPTLLLEAGGSEIPENVRIPQLWFTMLGSEVDWSYNSTPQSALHGRQTFEPRGKIPGGSSNFYIMMHIRGHRSDWDNYAYGGCPGWAYDDVLKYFRATENQEDDTNPTGGKSENGINLINAKDHNPNPTSQAFIDACLELGFPPTDDFNGPNMEGTGWHHINIKDGKRHGANEAFIEPIMSRDNFTLSTNSYASRLVFEGNKCVGVEYVQDGETKTARANREVIVCGGALESPKLLMLSGIGPSEHLAEHGIETRVDLPGVGQNFHNHVLTGVIRECKQDVPQGNLNLSEAALFTKSDPGWVGPDLQIAFVHVPFDIIVGQGHPNSISILPGVVRPMSRGWIKLASADPMDKPLVNPNYMGAESDLKRMVQAIKLSRDIFATNAFSEWVGDELLPGPDIKTDDELADFVRNRADSYHHQSGSCKMGSDEMAVVDPELRVYGVDGLRVADASVFPIVPSGNCHAGILVIGEKCADMIKEAHGL